MRVLILIFSLILLTALPAHSSTPAASEETANEVGTISYFEGRVIVDKGDDRERAYLGQSLEPSFTIVTERGAMAEIEWETGDVTIVGENEQRNIGELYEELRITGSARNEGLFNRFRSMFRSEVADERQAEGGIRRDAAEVVRRPSPDELYWAVPDPVDIEEALELFSDGEYRKALQQFRLFLDQQPNSPYARNVLMLKGEIYMSFNNLNRTRDVLNRVITLYPESDQAELAHEILANISR